jgi:hypothetical protein
VYKSETASIVYRPEFVATDPEVPDSLSSSGSGLGSTQPREDK